MVCRLRWEIVLGRWGIPSMVGCGWKVVGSGWMVGSVGCVLYIIG